MKKTLLACLCMLVILSGGATYYFINISPSTTLDDIYITGKVTPYDENRIVVELSIVRLKDELADHYIYPIAKGLSNISFIDEEGYYTPGAIGSWSESEYILRKYDSLGENAVGFTIPTIAGEYKAKFTMEKTDEFQDMAVLDVYYIHVEKRFAKNLNWIKNIALQVI